MINIRTCVVIVLYNKLINRDNEFILTKNQHVYYLDNSTDIEIVKQNALYENCFSFGSNMGLSYAYNFAIEKLKTDYDYLVVFDDDTKVEEDFFEKLDIIIHNNADIDIFLPNIFSVESNKKAYPILQRDNMLLDKILFIKHNNLLKTINSGLVIKLNEETNKFNEQFFLYCIDYEYIKRAVIEKKILQVELNIFQNFSRETKNKDNLLQRIKLITADSSIYYNKFDYLTNYIFLACFYSISFRDISIFAKVLRIAFSKKRGVK